MSAFGSVINSSLIQSNLSLINYEGFCEHSKNQLQQIIKVQCKADCFLCKLVRNLLNNAELFKRLDKLMELYLIPFNICPIHQQVNEHINEKTNELFCHQCINDLMPQIKEINPNSDYYGIKQSFTTDLEKLKEKLNNKLKDVRLQEPPRNRDLLEYFKGKQYTHFLSRIASKTTHQYMHERWSYKEQAHNPIPQSSDKLEMVEQDIREHVRSLKSP